jgi:acetoin utilization protein AcuB
MHSSAAATTVPRALARKCGGVRRIQADPARENARQQSGLFRTDAGFSGSPRAIHVHRFDRAAEGAQEARHGHCAGCGQAALFDIPSDHCGRSSALRRMENDMRVQDVMTSGVKTIAPSTRAEDAWNMMAIEGIHHLVVTEGSRIAGVISSRDLGGRPARMRREFVVGDVMSARVLTIAPTATVRQAANLMRGHSIGCLVVATDGKVVGIVTVSDLLELLGRGLDRGAVSHTRWTLNHRVPHRKQHRAAGTW